MIKSPLNYVGGKFKLLPKILPIFPRKINHLIDLFCGGLNVGINVECNHLIANDNLTHLIQFYQWIYDNLLDSTIDYIEHTIKRYNLSIDNTDGYYSLRADYNTQQFNHPLDLFILVAYSFNHQIRFNNSHEFNMPFGKDRSQFNSKMKQNLIDFITKLKSKPLTLSHKNFDDVNLSELTSDDFVYIDPPYLISTATYNTGWNEQLELKLLNIIESLDKRNIPFALSNVLVHKGKSNDLLNRWIEKNNHLIVYNLSMDYSNCNYQTKDRGKFASQEVLITNYKN